MHIETALLENPFLVELPPIAEPAPAPRAGHLPVDSLEHQASLGEKLRAQMRLMNAPEDAAAFAMLLTEELDDHGYLATPLNELATHFDISLAVANRSLAVLQSCEPLGVGARDLAECLQIQLRVIPDSQVAVALTGHLDLIAAHDWTQLSRATGLSRAELKKPVALVRSLNPRPGEALLMRRLSDAPPDILVVRDDTGAPVAALNQYSHQRIALNLPQPQKTKSASDGAAYMKDQVALARNLVQALNKRQKTLGCVAGFIMKHHTEFFSSPRESLAPLSLAEIGVATKLHPSTVSRAIAGKSLMCDRGIFALNYFLSRSFGSNVGRNLSANHIQRRIRELIEQETGQQSYSDSAITDRLRQSGVDISRRTVAKYRECMKIPSSVQRRRSKRVL